MREIKYRAKSWFGNPQIWDVGYIHQGLSKWWMNNNRGNIGQINPDTIGQYTGFKDSEGKEIFEGDIIQFHDRERDIAEILWRSDRGCFTLKFVYDELPSDLPLGDWLKTSYKYKVIGNIHDNPELLSDEHERD